MIQGLGDVLGRVESDRKWVVGAGGAFEKGGYGGFGRVRGDGQKRYAWVMLELLEGFCDGWKQLIAGGALRGPKHEKNGFIALVIDMKRGVVQGLYGKGRSGKRSGNARRLHGAGARTRVTKGAILCGGGEAEGEDGGDGDEGELHDNGSWGFEHADHAKGRR